MGEAKHFFVPYAVYGVSDPGTIHDLKSSVGTQTLAYFPSTPNGLTDDMHAIMSRAFGGINDNQISVLNNPEDILTICKQNLRGASKCYGGIQWNNIDKNQGIYNYTLRGNSGLSYINVGSEHESSTDVYVLPLQWAMDRAISEFASNDSTSSGIRPLSVTPASMPYTSETNEQYKNKVNRVYMETLYNWIAPAFFLSMIGVVYHLAGLVAQEHELGLSNLLTSMGVSTATRFLAYFLSFSSVYFIGWIVIAIVLSTELYMKTNAAIVIFYHIFSGFSMVSYSIFLGSLFYSAQLAGIVASGVSVFLAIMTTVQTRIPDTGPYKQGAIYVLSFLFPPCNYSYFISAISRYQREALPTNMVKSAPGSNILVIVIFVAAIVQIFLFFVLALLVNRWLYGFAAPAERETDDDSIAVSLSGLWKRYYTRTWKSVLCCCLPHHRKRTSEVVAVKDLSLDVRHGQIVCLLGANGSGKTTTLEMIGGVQSRSEGNISIRKGSKLGLCPQKNVLWDNLTVEETVSIWAGIKGVARREIKEATRRLIEKCDLTAKRKTRAKNLSGGQKRKLQLAIMFVGGSDICCIDEASSGLDPVSRRKIWDILLENRGETTLILTTHFLDEADLLADHIVIMSRGQLKTEGTSVALKHKMGGGFRVFNEATRRQIAHTATASEVVDIVETLDRKGTKYFIVGPSLENVFLHVAKNDHEFLNQHEFGIEALFPEVDEDQQQDSEPKATNHIDSEEGMRNHDSNGEKEVTENNFDLRDQSSDGENIVEYSVSSSNGSSAVQLDDISIECEAQLAGKSVGLFKQTLAMIKKRAIVFRRAPMAEIVTFLLPIIVAVACRTFVTSFNGSSCSSETQYDVQTFTDIQLSAYHMAVGPEAQVKSSTRGMENFANDLRSFSTLGAANMTDNEIIGFLQESSIFANESGEFESIIQQKYSSVYPGGIFMDDTQPIVAYQINGDDVGTYTGPSSLNMLNNLILNGTINLVTDFSPFQNPWTDGTGNSLQFVVYFGLAMAVAPAFVGLYPTYERLSKVRAMQYSNGLRVLPLWMAYTLFNFAYWIVLSAILTAIIGSASSKLLGLGYLFVCFMLYGLGSILVSFVFSLVVQSQLAAFAITAAVQAIYFLIYLIVYLSILAYGSPLTIPTNLLIAHFVMAAFMPVANMVRALFVSFNLFGVACRTVSNGGSEQISYLGDIEAFGGPILYMVIQVIVLFSGLLWWESGKYRWRPNFFGARFFKGKKHGAIVDTYSNEIDESDLADIAKEAKMVEQGGYDTGLKLEHVCKIYGNTCVVDDVSYGVKESECFALLGPNGAGKTTTFNMIRGEVHATSGDISVNGISIANRSLARTRLGVCPQFDAMDKMSVTEILRFYAKLRGLTNVEYHVDRIIEAVGLSRFRTRMANKLSGGNKRKLSLAIALIGDPPVLLLDEPSSGMDAFAKRIMWRTLESVAKGRCIVLTTHSMEEADYLASRAGFLARKLLAVGSTDYLRKRYGGLHHLHVVLKSAPHSEFAEMEKVSELICQQFLGAYTEDKMSQGQIRIAIPSSPSTDTAKHSSNYTSIPDIFRALERCKTELQIESYVVTETSLEEVFLRIVGGHTHQDET